MTKILFLGSHVRSAECLQHLTNDFPAAEVIGLVLNRSNSGDYNQYNIKAVAQKHRIPIVSLESAANLRYDIGISILFDRKLAPAIVDAPPRGIVNLHLGPLPRLRGVNSIYHAIIQARPDNDWMFGVTLHYIDHGLDTGPIIDKIDFPILPDDTGFDLYRRATGKIPELFTRNIGRLLSTDGLVPALRQSGPSHYFKRTDITLEIDIGAAPEDVYDAIRALTFPGKPKPFALVGNRKIYLSLSERD